jgi:hypothetical protein
MRALFAVAVLLFAATAVAEDLRVERAWIREAPPGAPAMAGFMAVVGGSRDVELKAARSADFARVEFHEMSMTDGVMKMRPLESLEVPAGARLTLAPGGEHLMLFDATRPLVAGDKVIITLELSRGKPLDVEFVVGSAAPATGEHAGH